MSDWNASGNGSDGDKREANRPGPQPVLSVGTPGRPTEIEFERLCHKLLRKVKADWEDIFQKAGDINRLPDVVAEMEASSYQLLILGGAVAVYGTDKQMRQYSRSIVSLRILIDDTSRLARNVADALKMLEVLKFRNVGVTFVSQGIDTLDKMARQLVMINGMMDEQFLVGLADRVHRGQEGRVLKGLNPGDKLYGYINVPILNPNRPGKYGRSPQPSRNRVMRAWGPSSIREMLRNEPYRGVRVWNRTVKARNPETGRRVSKARPKEEWERVEVPKLRIISEELWNAVRTRIELVNAKLGAARLGGMNRTVGSRSYLFSGLLVCGEFKSRLVIISGRGKRGYVKYGCPAIGTVAFAITLSPFDRTGWRSSSWPPWNSAPPIQR